MSIGYTGTSTWWQTRRIWLGKYQWRQMVWGPAAAGVLGVTISEDVGPSTKNGTEGSYHAICCSFLQ